MKEQEIKDIIEQGENSSVEFKSKDVRPDALAREMVAFSNTSGGILLLGVEDNGDISGLETGKQEERISNIARNNIIPSISPKVSSIKISDKYVLTIKVLKGKDKPYQTLDGKFWIRVGSTNRTATKEELSRLFQQAGMVHFDISPVAGTGINDIDMLKTDKYFRTYYDINFIDLDKKEQLNILYNADILVDFESSHTASVGGLLMFGKQPQRRLPQSSVIFAVFKGKQRTDQLNSKKEVIGDIPNIIDNICSLVQLFLPNPSEINNIKREDKILIPSKVIREVIVNAAAHRDYSLYNQKISVYLFDDRLEITSPGSLPNTLTIEKIRYGNSAPRNIFLIKYLDNMRYIDGLGRGVPMIFKEMKDNAEMTELGNLFRVVLKFSEA